MGSFEIAAVGMLVVAFAVVSARIERWPLTMPMVFVTAGAVLAHRDLVEVDAGREVVAVLAEITLGVILFSDAVRIDLRRLRRHLDVPIRLLAVGLPLTIAFGIVVNGMLFPNESFAEVALLAAVLAPTDAALGSAVIEDEAVPIRDRLALNVESGVNDGLVVPAVAVFTAMALDESRTAGGWVTFVVRQVGWGVAVGVAVGIGGVTALRWAHRRGWSDSRYEQLATFVLPVIALFAAAGLEGNSFIAAFAAGLAFGSAGSTTEVPDQPRPTPIGDGEPVIDGPADVEADREVGPSSLAEFTEDAAQFLALGAFFVFGNVLLGPALDDLSLAVVTCALLTLTIVRMLPVWVALVGSGVRWPSRLFIGWFGPRGLASILFGLLLLEDFERNGAPADDLFGVIAVTVTASVVLHGATAASGARAYGRWVHTAELSDDERASMHLPGMPGDAVTPRWARRR